VIIYIYIYIYIYIAVCHWAYNKYLRPYLCAVISRARVYKVTNKEIRTELCGTLDNNIKEHNIINSYILINQTRPLT